MKTTTLRKIIENAQGISLTIQDKIPEGFSTMNKTKQRNLILNEFPIREKLELCSKPEAVYIYYKSERPTIIGSRMFNKKSSTLLLVITAKTVEIKQPLADGAFVDDILSLMNIRWAKDMSCSLKRFLVKPAIFKAVLTNRVYSEETLVKRIASQVYRIKNIQWRLLRDYIVEFAGSSYETRPYWLATYTKEVNNSMKRLLEYKRSNQYNELGLISDMLKNAIVLDKKVNLNWSEKRMKEEHSKMVAKITESIMDETAETPIHDNPINENGINMLNSEKDVYTEGKTMRHCIYTNYRKDITNKNYLAFHMTEPEICTIGIRLNTKGKPVLDQAYGFANSPIQHNETMSIINDFVENNSDKLMTMLKANKNIEENCLELPF